MKKKSVNILEEHVEKIFFALAVLACGLIGFKLILFCPNVISLDNKEFKPGQIDMYISEQAREVQAHLDEEPKERESYKPKVDDFAALMASSLSGIDADTGPWQPGTFRDSIQPKYRMPELAQVTDVAAGHIRAAAYIPVQKISTENVDDETAYAPNDIDLMTVEAKFDVSALTKSFQESFAGSAVKEEWRDPCLARPVFAAVDLQRQRLADDGTWSEWERVARSQVDPYSEMFGIIEDVERLGAGGITVRVLKFDAPTVQADLLQPATYQIASVDEEWFPPSIHKEYVSNRRHVEAQEKREARAAAEAAEKEERSQQRDRAKQERRTTRPVAPTGGTLNEQALMQMLYGGGPTGSSVRRPSTRKTRTERRGESQAAEKSKRPVRTTVDVSEFYNQLEEVSLIAKVSLTKMSEPLVFWGHDDTVQPGSTYHYRIRLGVFNPVAGTEKFAESDLSSKDKVILWSEFSDTTEAVTIPSMLYFFPVNVQEAAKAVEVQVSKYALGYWYSEQFLVKRGETIGGVAEPKLEEEEQDVTIPEEINYYTGAILVDLVPVNDWTGKSLHARGYFDMLYSSDGERIDRVPVKLVHWPNELRLKYNEIRTLAKKTKEPLRAWGGRGRRRGRRRTPIVPGQPGVGGMTPDQLLMMELMMDSRRR